VWKRLITVIRTFRTVHSQEANVCREVCYLFPDDYDEERIRRITEEERKIAVAYYKKWATRLYFIGLVSGWVTILCWRIF